MAGYAKMLILPFLNVSKYISMHKQTKALWTQAFLNPYSDRNMKTVLRLRCKVRYFLCLKQAGTVVSKDAKEVQSRFMIDLLLSSRA